ncbi:MAG TPA: CHAT domain-containing protein [Actinoplanes sp.]|nr:CHAT domain-containing protein [Actinoplanes sp.]
MGERDDDTTRCAAIACAVIGYGDLAEAITALHRLPAGLAARGPLAAGLIDALVRDNPLAAPDRLRALDGLLAVADTAPPASPRWRRVRAAARALTLTRAAAELELADPAAAIAELDTLGAEVGDDRQLRSIVDSARMGLSFARSLLEGDEGALERFPREMTHYFAELPDTPEATVLRDLVTEMAGTVAANQRGEDVSANLDRLRLLAEELPSGHHLRAATEEAVATLTTFNRIQSDDPDTRVTDEELTRMVALTERAGLSDADRALAHGRVGGAALGLGNDTDPARVDLGVSHLRRAVQISGPDDPHRVFHLTGLALGLYRRSALTNATADLREAHTILEQARELAGGPAHPQWSMINGMLADVRQLLGTGADFHHAALDGLRSYLWKVLLQPDLAGAAAAVRSAAQDAVITARQSLIANDPAAAISALDAGRGLALFAATEVRTVADRLDDAGEAELARRWRAAVASGDPAMLPADLRREVLKVLSAHSSAATLLDPPGFGEIQRALAEVDADALVYLMPGEGVTPGYAVAAPVTGRPSYLALPNLLAGDDFDIEHHLAVLSSRDPAQPPHRDMAGACSEVDLTGSLDQLCDWAWRAAIGPLVKHYLPRLPKPGSDRPHRVVLVPMGDLARVPWQAARRRDGTYAVQLIGISQAASARMLCFSAALPPVPPSPVGLVVGDPDTGREELDLKAARLEAYAVRESFYRGARYIGRRPNGSVSPSGAGTSDEIRDWLTATGPAAGATLHLACHGFVQTGPRSPTAHLLLAGGKTLTAEELAALMASAPHRAVDLVVLAACRTGNAINGYDEAYSLGTAFLAGGARSVLSTQWSIPDDATSVLMYMFHYYLRAGGHPAWAALRLAQLWMLDPARVVPDGMPKPLRAKLGHTDLGALAAWAAFVHWGR